MRITDFKVTNIDSSAALEEYTEKKLASLDKLCSKYSPCDVAIELGKSTQHHHKGQVFFARFNLTLPGGLLRSMSTKEDLYEAVDDAKDDLKRQLVDWKERAPHP